MKLRRKLFQAITGAYDMKALWWKIYCWRHRKELAAGLDSIRAALRVLRLI